MKLRYLAYTLFVILASCIRSRHSTTVITIKTDSNYNKAHGSGSANPTIIETGGTTPAEIVSFARSLKGTPYLYGSTNPKKGFDCSGFITYVFNHFNISVPRSSKDFNLVKREINVSEAQPGDLILFTGTDSTVKVPGHMGIVVSRQSGQVTFIHATSGKQYAVTETPLDSNYQKRYLKTIRIFPQNNRLH